MVFQMEQPLGYFTMIRGIFQGDMYVGWRSTARLRLTGGGEASEQLGRFNTYFKRKITCFNQSYLNS